MNWNSSMWQIATVLMVPVGSAAGSGCVDVWVRDAGPLDPQKACWVRSWGTRRSEVTQQCSNSWEMWLLRVNSSILQPQRSVWILEIRRRTCCLRICHHVFLITLIKYTVNSLWMSELHDKYHFSRQLGLIYWSEPHLLLWSSVCLSSVSKTACSFPVLWGNRVFVS